MMKKMIRVLACVLVLLMVVSSAAWADNEQVVMSGSLQPTDMEVITAPMSGSVLECAAKIGEKLTTGDALVVIDTVRIYAPCTGTVAAVRAKEGDSLSAISALYGAAMYVEPRSR